MTTMAARPCPACGVVTLKGIGRCPSCRAWLGRRPIAVGLAGASLAVIAAWALIQMRGPVWAVAPSTGVRITPGIHLLSLDERGTDAWATITNPNPMPVEVTILVRGLDINDRPAIETVVGPFSLSPGKTRDIRVYLDATPVQSVTYEAIAVNPSDPDPGPGP